MSKGRPPGSSACRNMMISSVLSRSGPECGTCHMSSQAPLYWFTVRVSRIDPLGNSIGACAASSRGVTVTVTVVVTGAGLPAQPLSDAIHAAATHAHRAFTSNTPPSVEAGAQHW